MAPNQMPRTLGFLVRTSSVVGHFVSKNVTISRVSPCLQGQDVVNPQQKVMPGQGLKIARQPW